MSSTERRVWAHDTPKVTSPGRLDQESRSSLQLWRTEQTSFDVAETYDDLVAMTPTERSVWAYDTPNTNLVFHKSAGNSRRDFEVAGTYDDLFAMSPTECRVWAQDTLTSRARTRCNFGE